MITTAAETTSVYIFTVTEGEQSFVYEWGKQPPQGQTAPQYLQSCRREAELLAADEIAQQQAPTPINL